MARPGRPPKERRALTVPDLVGLGLLAAFFPPGVIDRILEETAVPMALPSTPGAWYRQWGVMSLDGSTLSRSSLLAEAVAEVLEERNPLRLRANPRVLERAVPYSPRKPEGTRTGSSPPRPRSKPSGSSK